jgi:hypothetical protein
MACHVSLRDLSLHGARIRFDRRALLRVDEEVLLSLPKIGEIRAIAVRGGKDREIGLRFHELTEPVRHALTRELFTDPAKHVRLPKVLLWPVTKGLIARFLRAA